MQTAVIDPCILVLGILLWSLFHFVGTGSSDNGCVAFQVCELGKRKQGRLRSMCMKVHMPLIGVEEIELKVRCHMSMAEKENIDRKVWTSICRAFDF